MLVARRAGAAGIEGHHHVVAGLHLAYSGADLFHHPGALMAENGRHRRGQMPGHHHQIGVADPGGDDADQDFTGAGLFELQRLDAEVGTDIAGHGCLNLHGFS